MRKKNNILPFQASHFGIKNQQTQTFCFKPPSWTLLLSFCLTLGGPSKSGGRRPASTEQGVPFAAATTASGVITVRVSSIACLSKRHHAWASVSEITISFTKTPKNQNTFETIENMENFKIKIFQKPNFLFGIMYTFHN